MAYPEDKETFITNRETGDEIIADDHNLPADFLNRLQETLGYGADFMKVLSNILIGDDNKIYLSNDKNTYIQYDSGEDRINIYHNSEKIAYIYYNETFTTPYIASTGNIRLDGQLYFAGGREIVFNSEFNSKINYDNTDDEIINSINGIPVLEIAEDEIRALKIINASEEIKTTDNFKNETAGNGIILKTPDGTKEYIISVDNSGNVISTLVT